MKSILIAGAALMVGASIYGFVDYKKNQNKKEFKKMYVEAPAETAVTAETIPATASETKKEAVTPETKSSTNSKAVKNTTTKKKAVAKKKKRTLSTKLFSRGALDERYIEPIEKEEVKTDNKKTEEKEQ